MERTDNKAGYISLKEAAEISGYAPDYIGQLIRSGKIAGKQVYSNVAWVTTTDAIIEYVERGSSKKNGGNVFSIFRKVRWRKVSRWCLRMCVAFFIVALLALFYISSSLLEQEKNRKSMDRAGQNDSVL